MIDVLGKEHVNAGLSSVGDPHLLAVEQVVRAVVAELRSASHRRGVGAGAGFAEGVSTHLAGGETWEVSVFLFLGPVQVDGHRTQAHVNAEHHGKGRVDARKFLHDDGFGDVVQLRPTVFVGDGHALEAEFKEGLPLLDGRALIVVPRLCGGSQHGLGKVTNHVTNHLVFFAFEEVHWRTRTEDRTSALQACACTLKPLWWH